MLIPNISIYIFKSLVYFTVVKNEAAQQYQVLNFVGACEIQLNNNYEP